MENCKLVFNMVSYINMSRECLLSQKLFPIVIAWSVIFDIKLGCILSWKKKYLETRSIDDVSKIMRFRLNTMKIKANYKGKYNDLACDGCEVEQEAIEHKINCK